MMELAWAAIGAAAGAAVALSLRKAREAELRAAAGEERARLEARLAESERNLAEQKRLLEEAERKLADAFRAMAGEALRTNNEAFLRLAEQTLKGYLAQAAGDIELRKKAVEDLVKPIQESLRQYQEKADTLERERQNAYVELVKQLHSVAVTQEKLQQETVKLVSALRQPNVRGRWGEITLRRVVELAGLSEHCDFTEQAAAEGGEGTLRPDLVVHLPNRREIVVDAKAVLSAYLEALEAPGEEARQAALRRHAAHLRERVRVLAGKRYWEPFERSAEFVVLFVPGEPFLAAAVQQAPELIEEALAQRVVVATPTTLVALLKAVAYGWRQERLARNAQEVADLGRKLFESVEVWVRHLTKLREAVLNTVEHFNEAQASLERHVLSRARRMKELGVASDREVPSLPPVTEVPRPVDLPRPE
jgi:DNA recombination protein RmuC